MQILDLLYDLPVLQTLTGDLLKEVLQLANPLATASPIQKINVEALLCDNAASPLVKAQVDAALHLKEYEGSYIHYFTHNDTTHLVRALPTRNNAVLLQIPRAVLLQIPRHSMSFYDPLLLAKDIQAIVTQEDQTITYIRWSPSWKY